MITVENYLTKIEEMHVANFPRVLQEGHAFFIEAFDWYHKDDTVQETIDLYLDKLNQHMRDDSINEHIDKAFIERFLSLKGKTVVKEDIGKYISELQQAITTKKIQKTSVFARHIMTIQEKLILHYNDLPDGSSLTIHINQKWLNELQKATEKGLGGLDVQSIEHRSFNAKESKSPSIFQSMAEIDSITNHDSFRLPGNLGILLGDLERFELAITLEGDQGGGKTRFGYQLANAFAGLDHKVAVFSLEIGKKSDLIRRMRDEYIDTVNRSNVAISDQAPEGINTIRKYSKSFDVVLIDSWNKLDVHSSEFDKLRKDFPNTIFIVIFQRTTQGTIRGGTAPLFDAGINLEVVKVDDSFRNNYTVATKNRYGETGLQYNIYSKELINEFDSNQERHD